MKRFLYASVATAAVSMAGSLAAQTAGTAAPTPNSTSTIFLVDESGSMGGEHTFLNNFVPDVDNALTIAGFTQRQYGLIGFGASAGPGAAGLREFTVGSGQLGSAQDFVTAAGGLVTSGSTEDGYAAINRVLGTYPVSGNTTFVLVTDEDRDNTDASLSFGSIRDALNAQGISLAAILDVDIQNADGNPAISTDGTTALTQDGASFASRAHGSFTGGNGNTIADYADLALSTSGGCVADLNQLRSGGDAAAAFAAAFQTCVINAATESGIVAILAIPVRDATMTVAQDIRHKLRLLAQAMSTGNSGSGVLSTQGQVVDDVFDVSGLRGYANVTGTYGSLGGGNDLDAHGITTGLDYTFDTGSARTRIGAAFSYVDGSVRGNTSRLNTDTYQGSVYGVYRMSNGLQFSGDLQVGDTDIDTRRALGAGAVSGNTNSQYLAIGLEAGKRFAVPDSSAVLMPYAGLRQERVDQDAYTESNGGIVPEFQQDLSTVALGLRYELDSKPSFGAVETIIDASWNHVFKDDLDIGTGTVPLAPGNVDENRFELGINVAIETGVNSRVSLNLSGTKSDRVETASVGVGFQMAF